MSDTDMMPAAQSQLETMMRLAVDKGAEGAEVLERLVAMEERRQDREASRLFYAAFARVQAALEPVIRDRANEHTRSRYATLTAVLRSARPIYTAEGFSVLHGELEGAPDGSIRVEALIMHESGHSERRHVDVPIDAGGIGGKRNKTDTQAKGSTLTYAMRYVDTLIWCPELVDEDTDGARQVRRNDIAPSENAISEEQLGKLREHLDARAKSPEHRRRLEDALLRWAGVESLESLPDTWYEPALMRLQKTGA